MNYYSGNPVQDISSLNNPRALDPRECTAMCCDPHKLFPNTQHSAALSISTSIILLRQWSIQVLKEKKNKLTNKFQTPGFAFLIYYSLPIKY
jgi:hypothetical protein